MTPRVFKSYRDMEFIMSLADPLIVRQLLVTLHASDLPAVNFNRHLPLLKQTQQHPHPVLTGYVCIKDCLIPRKRTTLDQDSIALLEIFLLIAKRCIVMVNLFLERDDQEVRH